MISPRHSCDVNDIVEDALEAAESADSGGVTDNEPDPEGFGEPRLALLGYGRVGAEVLQREWVRDYPDVDTRHVQRAEAGRNSTIEADYAILVGGADDHDLAAAIGAAVPDETTSIAVPISTPESPVGNVETANATVSCPRARARELVTDLLAVLHRRTRISPLPQFYDRLRTVGRVHGFRGQQERLDSELPPTVFAEKLVSDALANPFDTGWSDASDHFFSLFRADDEATLETFDAVRDEVTDRFGGGDGLELFAVDTTGEPGAEYQLTLLRR